MMKIRHFIRLISIIRIFARYNALWPLENTARHLGGVKGLALQLILRGMKLVFCRPVSSLVVQRQLWADPARKGARLAMALSALGPVFVKFGQALSVRPDLVGEDVAEDLSILQDRLDPFSATEAIAMIEKTLGQPLDKIFSTFDADAVAAASIAQVHRAQTICGRDVAVKILRPDVERQCGRDIALFRALAIWLQHKTPSLERLRLVDVVDTFHQWMQIEMDLRMEGAAASELRENSLADQGFYVPPVDWERTGKSVLTLEWIEGIRIDDLSNLKAGGHHVESLLERCAEMFFLQVFRDGFFHADMHPGNMLVDAQGRLCPVDFGIMGRIRHRERLFLADMLTGFLDRDYRRVADVHFDMGYVPSHKSRELFMQALRAIGEPLLDKPLNEISIGQLLKNLFETTEKFDMPTQTDMLLLQKTMLVAEGVGRKLNPEVNMWFLARPMIEQWVIKNRGPEARAAEALEFGVRTLKRLPLLMEKLECYIDLLSEKKGGSEN